MTAGAIADFKVTGATPHAMVGIALSRTGPGPTALTTGGCGLQLVMMRPPLFILGMGPANSGGVYSVPVAVPPNATGSRIWSQGLDFGSCLLTNGVTEVIG